MDNRQIVIASLPAGRLAVGDFEPRATEVPQPREEEVLCRTLVLTIGAGQRAGLQGSASYAGAPKTGVVMGGTAVSRVEVSNAQGIPRGALVTCPAGWQEYSVHRADQVTVVDDDGDPAHHLGVYGTNGLTAYFGFFEVGAPRAEQTVVVSAAAGSVGHLVGQMAKITGCRAVGVAGSDDKCRRLVDELGFDATVNYRSAAFRDTFKAACGDGVDIYFDNTGGDILGAALRRMKPHGRIVCCGVVSQYDTADPAPGPRGVPGLLVNNRVRMEGFLVFDYADRYAEARAKLKAWVKEGKLVPWLDEFQGLEQAPAAFVDLLAGGNAGTRIVRVAEA